MEFSNLYTDESKSKWTRAMRTSDGKIFKYSMITKRTEEVPEDKIKDKDNIIEFNVYGANQLHNLSDVLKYVSIVKDSLCKNDLNIKYNYDFLNPRRLIRYLTEHSLKDKIQVNREVADATRGKPASLGNCSLLRAIDSASAGGCIIADKGIHEGKFKLFDIANSYNKFFIDYNIPSNPQFKTVDEIDETKLWMLYRLKIFGNFSQEEKWKFKTNRTWFTKWDIKIFDMFKIKYELIDEKNNCVEFMDIAESDFSWMKTVNTTKQGIDSVKEPLKKNVYKNLLSSFWGNICKYNCITEEEYGEEISDDYFHKTGTISGQDLYIHPEKFYLYAIAICKPFVLAYGRYRLLKQINKVEKKGYKVIYAHTDSIITNAKEKYFEIGSDIGQWKVEKETENGVEVKNVASKKFL